ncbi:MAG: hypothetical protein AAF790_06925, partial [Planctomycetota bacterium]
MLTAAVLTAAVLCGTNAAAQPAGAGEDAPAASSNPAVRAALAAPRKSAEEYARAVFVLIDLGEAG